MPDEEGPNEEEPDEEVQSQGTHTKGKEGGKSGKGYDCHKCGRTFGEERDLEGHMKGQHHKEQWQCSQCGKSLTRKHKSGHIRTHTPENFGCSKCSAKFRFRITALGHTREHKVEPEAQVIDLRDVGIGNTAAAGHPSTETTETENGPDAQPRGGPTTARPRRAATARRRREL